MIEQHSARQTAALRARMPAGRQIAACAGALALALPLGVLTGRALAPHAPAAPTGASHEVVRQQLTRDLATLAGARASGRAELRQALTPNAQEQAALGLARAYDDAASSLSTAPVVTVDALIEGLTRTQQAYAGLARAAKRRAAASFAAARRDVAREEARLTGALAAATPPASPPDTARPAAPSSALLALLVLVLGLAVAALTVAPRRRRAPARPRVSAHIAAAHARAARAAAPPPAARTKAPRRAAARGAPDAAATEPPAAAATAPPAAAPPAPRAAPTTGWTCEISWVATLRNARFRVLAVAPGRPPQVIARSANLALPPFLPPGPQGDALAAARALVRALLAAGWTPTTRTRQWYAQRFEWTGDGDPEPLSAPRPSD